jgi:Fe-S cluster assembly iron-binding protein IscA
VNIHISPSAANELMRLSLVSQDCIAAKMFLGITAGGCASWSFSISATGNLDIPVSRSNGITLFTEKEQVNCLKNINVDFLESLAGGSFLFSGADIDVKQCGSCFDFILK